MHFLLFFTLALLSEMLEHENVSLTGKQLPLKQQMTGLQIAAQGEFLSRIVRE